MGAPPPERRVESATGPGRAPGHWADAGHLGIPAGSAAARTRLYAAPMTWVDAIVIAVIALSGIVAYFRGFVRELLSIGAWIGAVLLALYLQPWTRTFFTNVFGPSQAWLADVAGLAAVFVVTLIVLKLVIAAIAARIRASVLGGVDKALGTLFGVARGAFLVCLAYIVAGSFMPASERWPDAVRLARTLPYVADGAAWIISHLPPEYRPRMPDPVTQRAPTFDELNRPPARDRT